MQKNKFLKINFLESIFSYILPKHGSPLYHLKIFFLFILNFLISYKIFSSTGQSVNSWVEVASAPAAAASGVAVTATNDAVYVFRGGSVTFWKYIPTEDRWVWLSSAPTPTGTGSDLVWTGGDFIYATCGAFTNKFWEYHISGDSWTEKASLPVNVSSGCSLAWTGGNYIYATQGNGTGFYMYDMTTNVWVSTTSTPAAIGNGSEMAWTIGNFGNYIYTVRGGGSSTLYRYNLTTLAWETVTGKAAPNDPAIGGSLVFNTTNYFFMHRGAASQSFYKYCLQHSSWNCTQDDFPYSDPADTPIGIGSVRGQRLACIGDYIYCFGGIGSSDMLRYRWRDVDPPGKITSFVAETGTNGGEINLSWVCPGNDNYTGNLPEGSTFYIQYSSMTEDVVFSTSSPQNVSDIQISTGPVIQGSYCYYTVGGLAEGVTYYFRIWAKDNAGNWSEISGGATAYAQITPLPPSSLTAFSISSSTIKLVWTPSNAVAYRIEHSSVSDSSGWIFRSTVSAAIDEYIDENLSSNTTYWYRMFGINSAGGVNWSQPSVIVSIITYPAAPTGFTITNRTATSITWSWQEPVGGCDGYRIYRATDNSLIADQGSATTFEETGLSTNTAYGRFVRAYNILGESLDSNHTTFYTLAVAPVNLQITEVYSSSVTLVWENGGNPSWTQYGVSISKDNFETDISTKIAFDDNYTQLTTTIVSLESDTTYYFRVWAYNGDGVESYYSEVISTKTLLGIPAKPIGFYGVALSTVSIKWEWSITKCATYYQIYNTDGTLLKNLEGNGNTTYVETELSPNTQYSRYVKAGNEYGISEKSETKSVYTLANSPSDLSFVEVSYTKVKLSWSSNGNPLGTKYEVSMSTDNFVTNFSTPIKLNDNYTSTEAEITGLNTNTEYWFRVRAFNVDLTPTDFVLVSTKTKTTGNLLKNEFFEEWVITSSDSAQYWVWSGTAKNLKRSTQSLVGDYSAEVSLTSSEEYLSQTGVSLISTKTYYAEVWVKGTGKVRVGIVRGGGGTATYGEQKVLSEDYWTKVSHSRLNNTSGSLGGIKIEVVRSSTTTGEKLYIGAVWLSDTLPPSDWPTVDKTPPAEIKNLTALTTDNEDSILLNWTSPGDDGMEGKLNNAIYRIKYSTTSFNSFTKTDSYDFYFSTTGVAPGTAVSYVLGGLKPGTSYYFGIIVCDDSGNWSTWTKDAQTNTANYAWVLDLPPPPPTQISATASNRKITLSWQNPSPDLGDIDKYWVYYATFSFDSIGENVVHIATVNYSLDLSTKIFGLKNGTTYFFRIIALDKGDEGDGYFGEVLISTYFSPLVYSIPKISPPSNLKALHCGSYVSLSWVHSQDYLEDNFRGYRIYRSTDNINFVLISTTSNTSFKDESQIDKKTKYYYYLCTFDDSNVESEKSNIAEAIPDLIPPKFVLVSKLTSRDLGKQIAKVDLKVVDDRFQEGDRQGSLVSLEGKFKEVLSGEERNVRFNPEFISGITEYIGCAEFDFTLINLSNKGIKYQFFAEDEVNTSYYPPDGGWEEVLLPEDKPEQKFITPKNPEVIFGSEVEEVIIRDSQGNELWAERAGSSNKIIVWRGKDKNGKSLESGAYIYQIKTKEGKRKYGVVIVVK